MTDLRQAAQQALEALIDAANVLSAPMFADAVDALKAALEQQAEPPPEWLLIKNILDEYGLQAIDFVAEFKAAQQVATIWKQAKPFLPEAINTTQTAWKMGYEAAKAEQQQAEPVAVYQWRKQGCADWYDGHPDYSDCGGPYETRTLRIAAMQVHPLEFCQMVEGKETVTGIPMYWAEWPSKEVV